MRVFALKCQMINFPSEGLATLAVVCFTPARLTEIKKVQIKWVFKKGALTSSALKLEKDSISSINPLCIFPSIKRLVWACLQAKVTDCRK